MAFRLKSRDTTKYLFIVYQPQKGANAKEVKRNYLRKGYFAEPYHLYIDLDGGIHKGRELDSVGSSDLIANETHILILVDAVMGSRINNTQKVTLESVKDLLTEDYGDLHIVEKDGFHKLYVD